MRSTPPPVEREAGDGGVERPIAGILFWGGLLGTALMMLGLLLYAGRGGFGDQVLEVQRAVRPDRASPPPGVFVSLAAVARGLAARPVDPLAVSALGLVLLLITPVVGVAASIPAFLRDGDRVYAAIAGAVLSLLVASLLVAGGAG